MQCKSDARCLHARPKCQQWKQKIIPNDIQLVVISEGGLGDTLHFMRYIKILRNRGAKVSLCAQSELHSLIRESSIHSSPLTPEQANQVSGAIDSPPISSPASRIKPDNPVTTGPTLKQNQISKRSGPTFLLLKGNPSSASIGRENPHMKHTLQEDALYHSRLSLRSPTKQIPDFSRCKRDLGVSSSNSAASESTLLTVKIRSPKPLISWRQQHTLQTVI